MWVSLLSHVILVQYLLYVRVSCFRLIPKKNKKEVDYVIIFHMIRMSLAHAMTCMHVHTSLFVLVCMRLIVLTVRY